MVTAPITSPYPPEGIIIQPTKNFVISSTGTILPKEVYKNRVHSDYPEEKGPFLITPDIYNKIEESYQNKTYSTCQKVIRCCPADLNNRINRRQNNSYGNQYYPDEYKDSCFPVFREGFYPVRSFRQLFP